MRRPLNAPCRAISTPPHPSAPSLTNPPASPLPSASPLPLATAQVFVEENFGDYNEKAYEDIRNYEELYMWARDVFTPGLLPDEYYNGDPIPQGAPAGRVGYYNKIVGAVRIRQQRVTPNAGCQIYSNVITNFWPTTGPDKGIERVRKYVTQCYSNYRNELTWSRRPFSVLKSTFDNATGPEECRQMADRDYSDARIVAGEMRYDSYEVCLGTGGCKRLSSSSPRCSKSHRRAVIGALPAAAALATLPSLPCPRLLPLTAHFHISLPRSVLPAMGGCRSVRSASSSRLVLDLPTDSAQASSAHPRCACLFGGQRDGRQQHHRPSEARLHLAQPRRERSGRRVPLCGQIRHIRRLGFRLRSQQSHNVRTAEERTHLHASACHLHSARPTLALTFLLWPPLLPPCRRSYNLVNAFNYLEENTWLDRQTRAIYISVTVYNANLNTCETPLCPCRTLRPQSSAPALSRLALAP